MRRVAKRKQAVLKAAAQWRRDYLAEHWLCMTACGKRATECHEISRGVNRFASLTERCALLALCHDCHAEVQGWPLVKQYALKCHVTPLEYDRVKLNRLRGRADDAITEEEVLEEMRKL